MKGRPVTLEEFERMLKKIPSVVGPAAAPSWAHYLRGLWVSGLRLSESLELWWDRDDRRVPTFPAKGRPMLRIPAELEKGHADRRLPMAPEFALFLLETPEAARIMPAQLKELMRHESIDTTLRYYVGTNAERTADACWDAFDRAGGATPPPVVQNGVSGACA